MLTPQIFLNELSISFQNSNKEKIRESILKTISALKEINAINPEVSLNSEPSIPKILITNKGDSFTSILSKHKDHYLFLLRMEDKAPTSSPEYPSEEIRHNNRSTRGLTAAYLEKSLTASFCLENNWDLHTINAIRFWIAEGSGTEQSEPIEIANISTTDHIEKWKDKISYLGHSESHSFIIHTNDAFIMKMYANDHNPPHIHILRSGTPQIPLSRIKIETIEAMDNPLPKKIKPEVLGLIKKHQKLLLSNWSRCREGKHPIKI